MHSPAKRVAINTGFLYARMAITVFISLYATRLVLAALGANDFGLFNVVGGAIAMLTFLNNAMSGATQRFMSFAEGEGNTEKQKNIFNVSMVLHLGTAFIVVLILEIAGYFLFDGILKLQADRMEAAKLIYQFLVVSTFFTIVSVPYDAVINAHENMLLVAILGILDAMLKLGIAVYITYATSDKLIVYGLFMAILSILLLVLRQIYCHRKYTEVTINIRKYYSKPVFSEMTGFAGWSFLGASSSMIANYGQGIVLNMFFGTVVNAAQGIAGQVSGQLGAFAGTMLKALNPVIAKSEGAGNRNMMLKASLLGTKLSFFLLIIFFVPVIIEMPYIFKLWLKYIPEYAIIFCRLYLIQNLITQMYVTLNATISAVGNIKIFQIMSSVFSFLPFFFSFFAFKFGFEPYYLYLIYILFSILSGLFSIYSAHLNCGLKIIYYFKNVIFRCFGTFILVSIIGIIPLYFMEESIIRLMLTIAITSITFIFVTFYFGLNTDERDNVKILKETFNRMIEKQKK